MQETHQLTGKRTIVGIAFAVALTPATSMAFEASDIIVRAGLSLVAPNESSDQLALNGSEEDFINAVGPAELSVDNNTQLGLTFEYMLTDNWGLELLAATPFEHTASGTKTLNGLDIADLKHLPPTLSAMYHFNAGSAFRPYVGAGINYTLFFDKELTREADAAFESLGLTGGDLELDNSWGIALQVGADYQFHDNWWLNASVRWIDIGTEVDVTFDDGTKVTTDLDIDPFVYSLKIAYVF